MEWRGGRGSDEVKAALAEEVASSSDTKRERVLVLGKRSSGRSSRKAGGKVETRVSHMDLRVCERDRNS